MLPTVAGGKLEKKLEKLLAELQKAGKKAEDSAANKAFNRGVREACTEFMLAIFGGYRSFVAKSDADDDGSPLPERRRTLDLSQG